MRKLEKQFVVALTPEAYTSKTCCHCLGPCGPWKEVEEKMGKTIRGLRRCQNEECTVNGGLPLNRDKNGAINIGTNFKRLFEEKTPIRSMTDEDIAFHRATTCLSCD
jgi:transposase